MNTECIMNYAVCTTAMNVDAKAIIAYTNTGDTPRIVSSFGPGCPIFAITQNEVIYRQLGLCWGITPKLFEPQPNIDVLLHKGLDKLREEKYLNEGDKVVIAGGTKVLTDVPTEELKQNWNIMEERLGRLEMDQRQQLNNKVVSKVKKVQDRVLRRFTIVVICLPFFCWYIVHNQMCDFSMSTWVLLFLFVAVIIARQFTWMLLLRKIDCLKMTVRLAESRFRMSFKVGIAVSVLCAVPLLASMIWDMSQMGDRYILIGAWTGLVVGLLIGIRLFLKAWSGIKELKEAITDLQ